MFYINKYESQSENEERMAAMAGKPFGDTAPEDIDEEPEVPCGCGDRRTCGECMRAPYVS